jgi:hypothetical protein
MSSNKTPEPIKRVTKQSSVDLSHKTPIASLKSATSAKKFLCYKEDDSGERLASSRSSTYLEPFMNSE